MFYGYGGGFRGASPPWPYVGIGRGGLPRCGYFLSGATYGPTPFDPQMSKEKELTFLEDQSGAIKEQLEQIEARIKELKTKKD